MIQGYTSRIQEGFLYDCFQFVIFRFQIKLIITFTFQINRSVYKIYFFISNLLQNQSSHWGSSTDTSDCPKLVLKVINSDLTWSYHIHMNFIQWLNMTYILGWYMPVRFAANLLLLTVVTFPYYIHNHLLHVREQKWELKVSVSLVISACPRILCSHLTAVY